ADPQFVAPVAASLAPTTAGNYRLQLGSPAIDAGNNSFVTAATDLDANPRIYNSIVDMGAYENQGNNVMDTTFYSDTVCQGQTYTDNNFSNLTVAGMYYKTLQGVSGDSLLVFTLIVNPVYFIQIKDTICDGGAYNFNGKSLTTADVYYDTLQAVSGCDSVVELELTVNPVYFIQIKDTICDGGAYNDANFTNLTVAGTYFDTLQTIGGCDSIIELTLTVNPVPITYIFDTICDGATYNDANFTNLTVAGMYYDTLQAVNSCDSIIALELTVNIVPITYIFDTICDGGAYNDANFTNLTVAGTYFDTLQAVSGCDSIIALELTVSSAITTYIFDTICDGATYNDANFTNLTVAGTYFDTLQNINGCDSIIELELTVSSAITTYIFDTICDGATYNDANFTNLTVAGTYYDTLQNINGCDSIIELELTVNSGYLTPIAATISQGDSYEFFGNILTVSGVYSDTLQSVGGCDSVIELTLSVLNANVSVEDITVNGKSSVRDGDNFSSQPECGSDYAEIHVVCDPSATVIINGVEENPSIVPLPKFGDNIFSITVIAPNGNAQTYTLTINKRLPFDQVIVMRWNNTLTVINNPANNGGFKFTSFKWFRNDFEISIDQSWSVSSTGEWINPNDEFYAEMTAEGYSEVLRTCKSKVVWRDIPKLYPNPVGKGQILHIEPDMSKEELKDAVLEVYDMTGKLVETLRAETLRAEMRHAASLQITIGNEYSTGVYLLILKAKNGKQEEMKVVVE
ncbi:MAG: T9SS type A sorting domain-containing protein, partial [Lentimicrobiaceae bacterium]|nr:T9SS type A sorting domain-containing protein [Lentimicrobiaceae bacterium]